MNRLLQIRRAHKSARPNHHNPAWMNTHGDLGYVLTALDDLASAGKRVTDAFRARGEAQTFDACVRTQHECEASMVALDELLARMSNPAQPQREPTP